MSIEDYIKYFKQSTIARLGRKIYNYNKDKDFDEFSSKYIDCDDQLTILSRNIEVSCKNVKDMIKYQKYIDIMLLEHLTFMEEKIELIEEEHILNYFKYEKPYIQSFAVSYKFINDIKPRFITNIENIKLSTSTSENPYRVSEIKTLDSKSNKPMVSSYKEIDYSCWNYIDNNTLKSELKGTGIYMLSYDQKIACEQIIGMLACESSRNPTTYITAPMILELIDYEYANLENEENKKSSIANKIFIKYFPMAQDKAVSISRFISKQLDGEDPSLQHCLDNGLETTNCVLIKKFIKTEKDLVKYWHDIFPDKNINELVVDWYGIELNLLGEQVEIQNYDFQF